MVVFYRVGGKGTRLRPITEDQLPKSLFRVGGKELIRYSIDTMDLTIVSRLVFAIDHKADQIRRWINSAGLPNIVEFSEQTEPGVLGAISAGANHIPEDRFIACNTDEIRLSLNLKDMVRFHQQSGMLATMAATYTNRLFRHRILKIRERDNRVLRTKLKPEEYKDKPEKTGLVNVGFIIMDKRVMDHFDPGHSNDWSGIIDPLCDAGKLCAYVDHKIAYFNVGTPEEFLEAELFLKREFQRV